MYSRPVCLTQKDDEDIIAVTLVTVGNMKAEEYSIKVVVEDKREKKISSEKEYVIELESGRNREETKKHIIQRVHKEQ